MNINLTRVLRKMLDGTNYNDAVARSSALRAAILLSWCALKKSDFDAAALFVAYIYVVMCAMSTRALLDEYDRAIVRGEQTSLAHGTPVSMTYRSILVDAHDVAASCVALGRLVTIFYVGKEQRGKKSSTLLYRVWEHCTSSGNADLREFAALYGHGGQQVLYALVMLEADSVLAEFAHLADAAA